MSTLHKRLVKVQQVLASLVIAEADFTVEDLVEAFRDLDVDGAAEIFELISNAGPKSETSRALREIDTLLENHGVDVIRDESHNDRYWGDAIAAYSNTGDTYATTILYDITADKFLLTSCGDWLENHERENGAIE